MKVVITGGLGFLGLGVARALVTKGALRGPGRLTAWIEDFGSG